MYALLFALANLNWKNNEANEVLVDGEVISFEFIC